MAKVFKRLEEDGISEGTHDNAIILFKDHVNREQFLLLKTTEGRAYWIRRHYQLLKQSMGLAK
jgi:hypothetical protein